MAVGGAVSKRLRRGVHGQSISWQTLHVLGAGASKSARRFLGGRVGTPVLHGHSAHRLAGACRGARRLRPVSERPQLEPRPAARAELLRHWRNRAGRDSRATESVRRGAVGGLSLIHISEPTRLLSISYAVFCLKK